MQPTIKDIIQAVSAVSGLAYDDIVGRSRKKPSLIARWMVYAIATDCGYSSNQIGRRLNRDHTCVLNARDQVDTLSVTNCAEIVRYRELLKEAQAWLKSSDREREAVLERERRHAAELQRQALEAEKRARNIARARQRMQYMETQVSPKDTQRGLKVLSRNGYLHPDGSIICIPE